jgi:xylulokinase
MPKLERVEARVVGGGARSAAWNQIKADVLGVRYVRLAGSQFGTWGAAMIAGKAAGLIPDLADHAQKSAVRDGKPAQPSQDAHAAYRPIVERYIRLQETLNGYFAGSGIEIA